MTGGLQNMAISYKSKLYDRERVFTMAVDWYENQPLEGVLYQGSQQMGVYFTGYYEFAWQMEQYFTKLQYPRSVMDRRELCSIREDGMQREIVREAGRRAGTADTFTIRVTHRQNASWQGTVMNRAGKTFHFSSFLELVGWLETDLRGISENSDQETETSQQRVEKYLRIVMSCPEVMKVLPDTLVYRFRKEKKSQTLMIRPMFYEHNTCQGSIYWKEHRKQVSFRSFLELINMMGAAIRDRSSWEEQADVI